MLGNIYIISPAGISVQFKVRKKLQLMGIMRSSNSKFSTSLYLMNVLLNAEDTAAFWIIAAPIKLVILFVWKILQLSLQVSIIGKAVELRGKF